MFLGILSKNLQPPRIFIWIRFKFSIRDRRYQNQVNDLQDRSHDLEISLENSKYALKRTSRDENYYSTLKSEKAAYLDPNTSKVHSEVREVKFKNYGTGKEHIQIVYFNLTDIPSKK